LDSLPCAGRCRPRASPPGCWPSWSPGRPSGSPRPPSSWSAAGRRCADGPAAPRPLAGPPQSCGLARLPGSTAPHRERTPMSPFREASVGQTILAAIAATILLVAAPARYQGIDVSAIGWIVLAWSVVWRVGEVSANGTARYRSGGNLVFRDANMRSPSLLGAIGTILLVVAPDQVGQVPVSTIGWVISLGAVVWLVVEAVANGVTRARGRRREQDPREVPPI